MWHNHQFPNPSGSITSQKNDDQIKLLVLNHKWTYPGNATLTKHKTNATYETTNAQETRTATEEPPKNGQ